MRELEYFTVKSRWAGSGTHPAHVAGERETGPRSAILLGRTASDMTTEEMEAYRAAWRRRQAAAEQAEHRRAEHARTVAREAARILREEFDAERIRLFGSLVRGTFSADSDIDLAVEGLPERDFFRAQGRLLSLSPGLAIDLVDVRTARPALRRSIESEGEAL